MAGITDSWSAELREVVDQQVTDLETAIAIRKEAAEVDEPAPDGDLFAAVLPSDVLRLIGDEMAAGHVTESVIYFIARNSIYELEGKLHQLREEKRQQMSRIASGPRSKAWAEELAVDISKEHGKFHDAWKSIPADDRPARYAGYEVWRDGDELHASCRDRDEHIKRQSFRTGYFVPAKKRSLKKS